MKAYRSVTGCHSSLQVEYYSNLYRFLSSLKSSYSCTEEEDAAAEELLELPEEMPSPLAVLS